MRFDRTPTDITVTKLDLSPLDPIMTEAYRKQHPDEPETTVTVSDHFGIVDTPQGLFLFNTDGVGNGPIPDDDEEGFDFYGYTRSPGAFGIMPAMSVTLSVEELKDTAVGPEVNLAEFIRTFGARLDNNYEEMRRAIEEARS